MKKYFLFILIISLSILNVNADNEKKIDYIISPEYSWIEQFYKKDLKSSDIEEIKKMYDDLDMLRTSYIINWITSCKWVLWWKIIELYNNLRKYIDYSKINDYNNYIIKNSNIIWIDTYSFKCKIDFEKKYKQKENKSYLTEKQKELIKSKIEKLDNNKIKLLNNKLDSLLKLNLWEKKKI